MQRHFSNTNLIILLGYMGSGKSTIGKALAATLDFSFVDLDYFLEQKHQCTVPELFKNKGVKAFREAEHLALKEVLKRTTSTVLSLGGGTPCYHDNMRLIKKTTPHTFYLDASPKSLADRLFPQRFDRPLIAHLNTEKELKLFIAKHLFERQSFYLQASHKLDVSSLSVAHLLEQLKKLL